MEENYKDLADYGCELCIKMGAEYSEARIIKSWKQTIVARNGLILGALEDSPEGIGLRVIVDGSMAFGTTERLDRASMKELVEDIVRIARSTKRKDPIRLSDEDIGKVSWATDVKVSFRDVSLKDKISLLKEIDRAQKKECGKYVKNRLSFIYLYEEEKYITTGEGLKCSSKNSIGAFLQQSNARGPAGSEQKFTSLASSSGWEFLQSDKLMNGVLEDCRGLSKSVRFAKKTVFDKPVDVVIGGEVSGIMAHENVGHPSEGDRILGREAAQAGESFYADLLEKSSIGEVVLGNETVSIIDDPTVQGNPGYYLYDDEGVKARRRYLIKNGKLNELLLNREYAARFGTKSTAAARAISYNREPIPRMANTFFEPGDYSLEEIIEDVREGILLKSFSEWNIDDRRFNSKYVGMEAYLIENGEVTDKMVKRPVLELTTYGILKNVDAVSKDVFVPMGLCGKGDPMQGVPVGIGGPYVRLRNIKVGNR